MSQDHHSALIGLLLMPPSPPPPPPPESICIYYKLHYDTSLNYSVVLQRWNMTLAYSVALQLWNTTLDYSAVQLYLNHHLHSVEPILPLQCVITSMVPSHYVVFGAYYHRQIIHRSVMCAHCN